METFSVSFQNKYLDLDSTILFWKHVYSIKPVLCNNHWEWWFYFIFINEQKFRTLFWCITSWTWPAKRSPPNKLMTVKRYFTISNIPVSNVPKTFIVHAFRRIGHESLMTIFKACWWCVQEWLALLVQCSRAYLPSVFFRFIALAQPSIIQTFFLCYYHSTYKQQGLGLCSFWFQKKDVYNEIGKIPVKSE